MSGEGETLILRWWNYQLVTPPASVARVARRAAILRMRFLPSVWELTAASNLMTLLGELQVPQDDLMSERRDS